MLKAINMLYLQQKDFFLIKTFEILKNNPLFQKIGSGDFQYMLQCLSAKNACYKKDDFILFSGDSVNAVGLILSGEIKIIIEDINGNSAIISKLSAPEMFGEVFACAGISRSPVTVQAAQDTEILFLNYKKIITSCSSACVFHAQLIENMLALIAKKNLMLNQKIEILSKRTTREKLQSYFDFQRGAAKKFIIPYNREELARYLCVDRSAMSSELRKMSEDGLIKFQKNKFEILD
ncbi:MAG TPA: Crp/Fnr family transcriptional regulator [Treponema sp.]|nr:Crp/Fnr family transcriptional regulator [Treponema sp.]